TRDRLVLFSTRGSLYVLRVADLPATTGYGEPVQSLLKFGDGERVVTARLVREAEPVPGQQALPGLGSEPAPSFLVATVEGRGFRGPPASSEPPRPGGRLAGVGGGDQGVAVDPIRGPAVVTATAKGKMLRFVADEVAELSGPGRGVILMRPGADDRLVGA